MDDFVYKICVETNTEYLDFGPFYSDKPLEPKDIKLKIKATLLANNETGISAEDIENICIVCMFEDCVEFIVPVIEDVWPTFFNKKYKRNYHKEGGDKI